MEVLFAVSLVMVALAPWDIQQRKPDQIRGHPLMWTLLCLSAVGAIAYFGLGRR